MVTTDYEKQAIDFLERTNTTFKAEFIGNRPYFDGDKESRDVYQITLERKAQPGERAGKTIWFTFGQSIANSGIKTVKSRLTPYGTNKRVAPSAYDVLAVLTKYDPGSFEDFCSEFGYDTDSKKAEKTFLAVLKEYHDLKKLFTNEELELMQEIQ